MRTRILGGGLRCLAPQPQASHQGGEGLQEWPLSLRRRFPTIGCHELPTMHVRMLPRGCAHFQGWKLCPWESGHWRQSPQPQNRFICNVLATYHQERGGSRGRPVWEGILRQLQESVLRLRAPTCETVGHVAIMSKVGHWRQPNGPEHLVLENCDVLAKQLLPHIVL